MCHLSLIELLKKPNYLAFPPFWKPLVHFVALGFILRLSLATLHLLEQNHSTEPSFVWTKADPVPGSMSFSQKIHFIVPTTASASSSSWLHVQFHGE
jgi:hypothetical protein